MEKVPEEYDASARKEEEETKAKVDIPCSNRG